MKRLTLLFIALTTVTHLHAGWFSDNDTEQRIRFYDQMLDRQKTETGNWQVIASGFAIGAVILFVVGAALGSKSTNSNGKR
jgi:hypothetical protein